MFFKKRPLQVEVLEPRRLLAADISLIRYFDTWGEGTIRSSDPAGLAYHPGTGSLYVADSEINELSEFEGNNLFEVSLRGDQTIRSIPSGNSEPTGITYNAFDGYFYVTNDDTHSIYRYDERLNAPFAVVSTLDAVATAEDPEGITSDPTTGAIYVVDGTAGGMQVLIYNSALEFQRRFSIADEMQDGEGIVFDPVSSNLLILSAPDQSIFEYQVDGTFVRAYNFSGIAPALEAPEGLDFAPTSDPLDDPGQLALYIADGRVDNYPDGRIFETSIYRSPPGAQTLRTRVATSSDDAEERSSGWITTSNPDLELVDDGGPQTVGMRFADLQIPPGASILNAYMQFQADETSLDAATLTIAGERGDDAATFGSSSGNISSRPRTAAAVSWSPPVWDRVGEATLGQRTPNLAAIVQEIVERPGWASGNALALIVTGVGRRVAESFDSEPDAAPLLHIEFATDAGPINRAPQVEAGADQAVTLPAAAALSGTVSDDGLPSGGLATLWSLVSGPGAVTFGTPTAPQTTASFSMPGTYVLRLTANDGSLTSFDDVTVIVLAANEGNTQTVEVRISASEDDAEERASGWITTNNPDLELVYDGGNQTVGLRFAALQLPAGATIQNAYVQFQVDEASSGEIVLGIHGENVDHAAAFSTTARSISSRERTGAAAVWTPAAWTSAGEARLDQRTPNLAAVVQEIVNRPGWEPGNALALIIDGTGARIAEAYDGDPAAAPLLHVEYTVGGETDAQLATNSLEPGTSEGEGEPGGLAYSGEPLDVNRDGRISPLDVLLVVNQLNRGFEPGARQVPFGDAPMPHTWDVNRDQVVSPLDALLVMNYLNRRIAVVDRGELLPVGEGELEVPSSSAALLASTLLSSMHLEATDSCFRSLEDDWVPG